MKPADSAAAAIRGATLAFQRDKLDQRRHGQEQQQLGAARQDNGAYTAATEAVRSTATGGTHTNTTGSRANVLPANTEQQQQRAVGLDARPQQQQQHQLDRHAGGGGGGASTASASQAAHLGLAPAAGPAQAKMGADKTSLIAATLAASRSTSPTTATTTRNNKSVRRAESVGAMSSASSSADSGGGGGDGTAVVDAGPLVSAGSLIHMFEKARGKGPSPPESVASGAEDKKRTTTVTEKEVVAAAAVRKKKPKIPAKGEARPPTPPPPAKARRDPADDGKSKSAAAAGVSGPQRSGTWASSSPTAQKQQQQQLQHQHRQHQHLQERQPARSAAKKAASPPPLPASPRRPMTPTSTAASATHPFAPAPSSSEPKSRPKSSHAKPEAVPPRALRPSTPPPLKPLMSRNVAEVVSPQPKRVPRTPLSPVTSPHLTLSPSIHVALASPSPDPQKKSAAAKRPPTPPKPRGSDKGPTRRPRSHSHHLDASAASQSRASIAAAAVSHSTGHSASPLSGQHSGSRPSAEFLSRRHSIVSAPSSPSRDLHSRRRHANGSPVNTQLENLTDAIVAGSLASSRLTPHNTGSSSLAPPPLPKRQKSPRLLHTLRQPHGLSDEEEDQHKKGHRALLRKGKHAHHEGSRKKWREEIRPRERKRYEALWASNRGILLTDTRMMSPATSISSDLDRDVSQCVANVVVREVWKRSRLPVDELAEIWDLVDRGRAGMLSRAEFVVGTWLVDQRLKGRKVPAKVTDSVWGSANGVLVKGPNGK